VLLKVAVRGMVLEYNRLDFVVSVLPTYGTSYEIDTWVSLKIANSTSVHFYSTPCPNLCIPSYSIPWGPPGFLFR
jgi:hypothetical protein